MKIALVHLNLSVESGDPRMFYSIARALQERGHTITIYTAQFDPNCFQELNSGLNIEVVKAPIPLEPAKGSHKFFGAVTDRIRRIRAAKLAVRAIARRLRDSYDMLVCENDYSYQLGRSYKQANPKTTVVWLMNNTPYYHEHKSNWIINIGSKAIALWERFQVRQYLPGVDIIVVHDLEHEKEAKRFGKPVLLLRIPVDFSHFFAPAKRRRAGDKCVTLLSVGSLSPVRKFEDTIIAASALQKRGYDSRVTLVCKDFWKNAEYKSMLLRIVERNDITSRVEFLFDGATEEELLAIQKRSDVFVFPNHVNIWGMAALEAMAAGLPLIVSRATSIAEVLTDGKHALFSEPGNPDSIADCVEKLIQDPFLYDRITKNGQAYVKEHLAWESYADRLVENCKKYSP